jgi:hypothetical protein
MLQADRIPWKRRYYYHESSWPLYFTRYVLGTGAEQGFMEQNCEVMEGDPGFQNKVNVPYSDNPRQYCKYAFTFDMMLQCGTGGSKLRPRNAGGSPLGG